jgi:hypothetical protein
MIQGSDLDADSRFPKNMLIRIQWILIRMRIIVKEYAFWLVFAKKREVKSASCPRQFRTSFAEASLKFTGEQLGRNPSSGN